MAEEIKTYYLKANRTHSYVKDGEIVNLEEGGAIELSPSQAESFKDKFSEDKPVAPKPTKEQVDAAKAAEAEAAKAAKA